MSIKDNWLVARIREQADRVNPGPAGIMREAADALEQWEETAAQFARNADYYREKVEEIGKLFGDAARTSDDGSVQDDVLAEVVPELVKELLQDRDDLRERIRVKAQAALDRRAADSKPRA